MHLAGETLAFDLKWALEAKASACASPCSTGPQAAALPAEILGLIKDGKLDGVILMSPRTAEIFAELLARHALVTKGSVWFAIASPRR